MCDVHRLQLLAATDDYGLLEDRLLATSRALEDVNSWAAGEGYYQLGEVRRLRGDSDGALAAFTRARALGIEPQPGEALLRCRMGDSRDRVERSAGRAGIRGPAGRMRMLRGAVEVALVRDALDEAEKHCSEMESGARAFGTPGFRAWAAHAARRDPGARARHAEALECCSQRCANTGCRSRGTRPPRSTNGWRSPAGAR